MNTFETILRKIQELYNQSKTNAQTITQKQNSVDKTQLDPNAFKHLFFIDDTGEVPIVPSPYTGQHTTTPGVMMPAQLAYDYFKTLTVATELLPFLEFEARFSVTGNRKLTASYLLLGDTWDSDHYEVTGDGDQIWKGVGPPSAPKAKITQAYIDDGRVLASHTKQAWDVSVQWTDISSGNLYRIIQGQLVAFASNKYDTSTGCSSNQNYTILVGSLFYETTLSLNGGWFTDINYPSFSLKGEKQIHNWQVVGGVCQDVTTVTEGVSKTFDISELDSLTIWGARQRWNGTRWVNDPSSGITQYFVLVTAASTISSFTATKSNFYLFYDTTLRFLFYIFHNSTPGPHFGEPVLGNLPTGLGTNPMPFTDIEWKVNPNPYPTILSARTGNMIQSWDANNSEDPIFFRMSKSTDKQAKWKVDYFYTGHVLAPGVKTSTLTYRQWDDHYGVTGSGVSATYVLGASSHGTVDRPLYQPPTDDCTARVRVAVRPPLNWKKTDKYDQEAS